MSSLTLALLALIPLLSAYLAQLATQGLKRASGSLDTAPALAKQGIAILLAFALVWLGNAVGHAVDPALALAPSDELLQGLAASALAHVFHAGAAKDRAKAQPYRNGGMGDPGPNT